MAMFGKIPSQMCRNKRWLMHQNKVPHYIDGSLRRGVLDGDLDKQNLATFDQAIAALQSGAFHGLGFALGDGWQGIDFDDVEDNGLQELANSLPGYVEYSPSGRGCHAIGYGAPFPALKLKGIEAYSDGRYFTVTGNAIGGELCDLAPFVAAKLEPLRPVKAGAPIEPPSVPTQGDADIVRRLLANPRHAALYGADTSNHNSPSEADLDLCNVLALIGCTPEQAERIWLASPRGSRDKTKRYSDYRHRTLNKAFATKPAALSPIDLRSVTVNGKALFSPTPSPAGTPTVVDAADLEAMPASPRLDMWGGYLPVGQTSKASGDGGSGKSLLFQQLATSIALGLPCLGIQTMPGVALYVTCEDDLGSGPIKGIPTSLVM